MNFFEIASNFLFIFNVFFTLPFLALNFQLVFDENCDLQYKGVGEGFKIGFNQKTGEERTSRYAMSTGD